MKWERKPEELFNEFGKSSCATYTFLVGSMQCFGTFLMHYFGGFYFWSFEATMTAYYGKMVRDRSHSFISISKPRILVFRV
jgi:hypothetical protein